MQKALEEKYLGKWFILKKMMPRALIATALCIAHIHFVFWLVEKKIVFPFLLITTDLTKCTIEVTQEACIFATTISLSFTYLQYILPLVILVILLLVIYTLRIPATSRGYSKKGKEVMIDLLLRAYIYSGLLAFAVIQMFFKHGFNKGNTYDDLALKYTVLYAIVIPTTLVLVYINKKRSKKRKLTKLKSLKSATKPAADL